MIIKENIFFPTQIWTERPSRLVDASPFFDFGFENPSDLEGSVKAHLRVLLLPRLQEVWSSLLGKNYKNAVDLRDLPGWAEEGENRLLRTVVAACGLGILTFSEHWVLTPMWSQLKGLLARERREWGNEIKLDRVAGWWTGDCQWQEARVFNRTYLTCFAPAWRILATAEGRLLLQRWCSLPMGISHHELSLLSAELGIKETVAMKCISAAVLVGAMNFTGHNWKPELFAVTIARLLED